MRSGQNPIFASWAAVTKTARSLQVFSYFCQSNQIEDIKFTNSNLQRNTLAISGHSRPLCHRAIEVSASSQFSLCWPCPVPSYLERRLSMLDAQTENNAHVFNYCHSAATATIPPNYANWGKSAPTDFCHSTHWASGSPTNILAPSFGRIRRCFGKARMTCDPKSKWPISSILRTFCPAETMARKLCTDHSPIQRRCTSPKPVLKSKIDIDSLDAPKVLRKDQSCCEQSHRSMKLQYSCMTIMTFVTFLDPCCSHFLS